MSTILEHPEAQELLAQTEVEPNTVRQCARRLTRFLQRYLPCFYRKEQRQLAAVVLEGRLSNLERKTNEPIARQAQRPRKPVQKFVGAGKWRDHAVLGELRRHVDEVWGDDQAVLIFDGSAFAK